MTFKMPSQLQCCKRCGATNRKLFRHPGRPGDWVYTEDGAPSVTGRGYPRLTGLRCTTCWRDLRANARTAAATKRRAKTYGGLTEDEYHALRGAQHDRCPLCGRRLGPKAVVDHDHSSGRVRGILCGSNCNRNVLGIFAGDHPEPFRRAIAYLEEPTAYLIGLVRYGATGTKNGDQK